MDSSDSRGDLDPCERNLLFSCPESSKSTYEKMAKKALGGSRAAAIRLKCLECCCWNKAMARNCSIKECALWGLGGQRG